MENATKPINPIPYDIRDLAGNFDDRFSGLTIKEYFAGQCMLGLLAGRKDNLYIIDDETAKMYASKSILLTNELLKQLDKK